MPHSIRIKTGNGFDWCGRRALIVLAATLVLAALAWVARAKDFTGR
jgi:hypothetical protein